MYFPVILLAVVLTFVAADVAHDVNDCQESSPLCDRLGQLERLLIGQSRLLGQLQSTVSRQEGLLKRQELKLSQQATLVQQLQAEKARDSAELKTVKDKLDSVLVNADHNSLRDDFKTAPSLSDSEDSVISVASNVMPRASQGVPLELVVDNMGQQLTEMSADIQALKNSDQALLNSNLQQDQSIQDAQTSTFVHWGSSQCSSASQLVYSGFVGGSSFHQRGAATNYLCLTMSPVASNHSLPAYMAYLYGGEYQTHDTNQDKDPLCAVCRSRHSTTIMIPGTNVCTPGWHQHYSGFLMAGYYNYTAGSEFICVDSRLESRAGSGDSHDGKLLYFTVAQCGSLPCDPYVNNTLVTCVVCSK